MSGNIENKQEGPRSHLNSLKMSTMKLMDKFHTPKIKRTPSTKGKPPSPEPPAPAPEKPVNKKVSRLEEQEKDVVSALRYFKAIVDKMAVDAKVLEMLPGSASKVLEAILPLVQGDTHNSSALSSCHNRVYQSLANLVRWSDDVMLKGIDLSDKETVATVTAVIKAVLDGVKELVKLTIEKQEQPSPTSPKPAPPVTKAENVSSVALPERDMALGKTTPAPSSSSSTTSTSTSQSLTDMSEMEAPPKPPLPAPKLAEHSAPILPAKKRQSVPAPMRIAVVAPMSRAASGRSLPPGAFKQLQQQDSEAELLQRRLSADSQSYSSDSPACLSSCGIMAKLSQSDEQLSAMERDSGQCSRNTSCETLDGYDPDYDFLHQDLSVLESLPPFPVPAPVPGTLSPLPECLSESGSPSPSPPHQYQHDGPPPLPPFRLVDGSLPPALPQKKRRSVPVISTQGLHLPPYPQMFHSQSEEWDVSERPPSPTPPFPLLTPLSPMPLLNGSGVFTSQYAHTPGGPPHLDSPPPLPEKKNRTIMQYMQFVEDYSEPQPSLFYRTPQSSDAIYENRLRRLQEVCGLSEGYNSSPTGETTPSPTPAPDNAARGPPPALPPKQRQMSESAIDEGGEGEYVNLYSNGNDTPHSPSESLAEDPLQSATTRLSSSSGRGILTKDRAVDLEDVDELSLIDHKDIMSLITRKQENDDGPDVRAGSVDILLVHATETDRKDLVLYCEAFLTTYRTFISPEELIKKLHYRYTRFCHSPDTFKRRVSKNTFFVLVRVVDELCHVELTEDILCQLMELVFQLLCNGELSLARVLRSNILDKVDQKRLQRHIHTHAPLAARGVSARPGTLHDFRSHEVADQLTLLDAELFYKIEIPEVLLWAKEQNEEKSPNLTQFTEHFNNMSYWVRSIIIQQERAQDREKLLLKFIKIMKHLRKLNNFNSYLAILSALDSAPIRRLEWQKQTSEGLEEYCTLIDSSSSFRAYRAALAEVEPPCIPYLGLILQDLTFVHLGNPDMMEGKVNFSKRWQQFNILDSMRRFQQVHYELRRNDDIICFFNDFTDHLAEEALWELSLKIKPRSKKVTRDPDKT
ncbi:rap guanine nucleotide exchange factor 1b isoform X2 [Engraulis encrasicolus]|uniref:rap guanine nucleotide exchange factor 1b isoform X2 n=1 Tax=Engraulis encrasicolus TaxID=184585 RepID=UPI002FD78A8B